MQFSIALMSSSFSPQFFNLVKKKFLKNLYISEYKFILLMCLNIFVYLYIHILCLSVRVFVSNKRKYGWTDRAKKILGPHMTKGKIYGWSKFKKLASIKIRFSLNFEIHVICFCKIHELFCFLLFYNIYKKKLITIEIGYGHETPWKPNLYMCIQGVSKKRVMRVYRLVCNRIFNIETIFDIYVQFASQWAKLLAFRSLRHYPCLSVYVCLSVCIQ